MNMDNTQSIEEKKYKTYYYLCFDDEESEKELIFKRVENFYEEKANFIKQAVKIKLKSIFDEFHYLHNIKMDQFVGEELIKNKPPWRIEYEMKKETIKVLKIYADRLGDMVKDIANFQIDLNDDPCSNLADELLKIKYIQIGKSIIELNP